MKQPVSTVTSGRTNAFTTPMISATAASVPTIAAVGRGLESGVVEIKDRRTGDRREVPVAEPGNAEAAVFLARADRAGAGERWRTREELLRGVTNAWRQAPVQAEARAEMVPEAGAAAAMARRLETIV